MTSSELNRFLDDKLTVDDIKASIAYEVEVYGRQMNKRGSTIELRFKEDDEITLDKLKFKKLLDFVFVGRLSNIYLYYICDCLTLADILTTDEKIIELIFEITEPENNGGYIGKEALVDMISKIK